VFTRHRKQSVKRIQVLVRESGMFRNTCQRLMDISGWLKLKARGWINYYAKFRRLDMGKVFTPINKQIAK